MTRLRMMCLVALTAVAMTLMSAPLANAAPISRGNTGGTKYRGGVPSAGGISYAAGLQINTDAAGSVSVRAAARISKISKVSKVQVDSVTLGTATAAVTKNSVPANSGTAVSITSYSNWKAVAAGSCPQFRVRANFSVRWTDGALSSFSVLSPLTTVCGNTVAALSCPHPSSVQHVDTNLLTITKCYASNSWILAQGLYGSGVPVDGIDIIHQTAPGHFVRVGQGSDFSGAGPGLRRDGVPASLVTLLTTGTWNWQGGLISHPRSAYNGTWIRHTSLLVIGSTRGSISIGDGCCNSISVPLTYAMELGVLRGTVSGPATYTGTEFNSVHLPVGAAFYFHFSTGQSGPVLVSNNLVYPSGGPIVWCGAHYDTRCGA